MKRAWQSIKHLLFRKVDRLVGQRRRVRLAEAAISETVLSRFLLVTYPHDYGWVAVMPDFRGATGRANDMPVAMLQALQAAQMVCSAMIELGKPLPAPLELTVVKNDQGWARVYGVDWSSAIIRTVSKDELIAKESKVRCANSLTRGTRVYAPR